MNYTPLPVSLTSNAPVLDVFTPEPPPTHSPYKKALATILIAMFLGIGTTYLYFRNTSSKNNNPATTPVVTVIPSPLPTVEPMEPVENLPTSTPESTMYPSNISPTTFFSQPTITQNPTLFSCSAGTVKVCQGGNCECVSNNQ